MRVRVKINVNDACSLCRFLKIYSQQTEQAWIVKQVLEDDYYRLDKHLRNLNTFNGYKKTGFTLDALTVTMLQINAVPKILSMHFDEANQYMIRYALDEVWRSISEIHFKHGVRV